MRIQPKYTLIAIIICAILLFINLVFDFSEINENIKSYFKQAFVDNKNSIFFYEEMDENFEAGINETVIVTKTNEINATEMNFSNIKEEPDLEVYLCRAWDGEVCWKIKWNEMYAAAVKKVKIGYVVSDGVDVELMRTNGIMKYIEHEKTGDMTYFTDDSFWVAGVSQGKFAVLKEIYIEDDLGNVINCKSNVIKSINI